MTVSDSFADERIKAKISDFPPKPRAGLSRLNRELQASGVDASSRLHLVSAVVDLGRVANATRPARLAKHAILPQRSEEEIKWGADFKD